MSKTSGLLRGALIAGIAVSMAGCGGMLSGDPFKDEAPETANGESLSYSLSQKIMTGFGGATDPNKTRIDYKPRAPLAVPPAMVLKQPEAKTDIAAEMPNWPKQHDDAKEYIAARDAAKTHGEKNRDDFENPVVPSREMASFRVIRGGRQGEAVEVTPSDNIPSVPQDQADKFTSDLNALRTAEINGVSRRKYLIEPPATYRTPAEGAPLPSDSKIDKPKSKHDDWEKPTGY